jgi:hypothetical protein
VSVSSLSARPSPVNGRVGIHDFTFEACSSFTHVTACKIACPPKSGLLSRGSDLASYPAKPLGSYHVSPTTTWVDPPSTGDLRRWGAPLTKSSSLAGESEKVEPNLRWNGIPSACSQVDLTSGEGDSPHILATSRTCLPSAVNRKAKECRSTIRLAPQIRASSSTLSRDSRMGRR